MLFVGTSIIHPSTEGVFLLCNILDLLIYSYDLVWSDKVGYVWLAISIDPIYIDTGNWIESAASLCYECLNDIALDVFGMTGNDHDFEDADPLELAEIKRRWKPYIDQLPEYAYICDELLSGRK